MIFIRGGLRAASAFTVGRAHGDVVPARCYNGAMETRHTLPIPLLQLGLTLGLYFILLWGGPLSGGFDSDYSLRGSYALFLHGGFAAVFAALFACKELRIHSGSIFLALCAVLGLVGFALPALMVGYPQLQRVIIAFSAFLASCAVSMQLFAGFCAMEGFAPDKRFRHLLGACCIGLAAFIVLRAIPESYRALVNCVVLFPLSFLATFKLLGTVKDRARDGRPVPKMPQLSEMLQLCASVFLLGLVSALLIQAGEVVQVYQVPIAVVAGIAFALLWRICKRAMNASGVYLVLFPLVATLLLVLPFGDSLFRAVAVFISNVAAQILLLTVLVQPQSPGKPYAPRLVATLLAVFHLSVITGMMGGGVFRVASDDNDVLMAAAVYGCLYALSAFAFALLAFRAHKDDIGEHDGTAKVGESCDPAVPNSGSDNADCRCVRAARAYDLSPREAEVLSLLLRGRDVRSIAEMLVISQNTVRFHIKNLYRAVGVHGKQELIDAVEKLE